MGQPERPDAEMSDNKKTTQFLTEVEFESNTRRVEVTTVSVRDFQDAISTAKKLAYTSAATILRILDKKGFVTSTKQGKTFIYQATLSKDTYQSRSLKNLSEKLFDNTPAALVARLVDDYDLTEET